MAEQAFYQTGKLIVPKIRFLGSQQMFSFQFEVTSDECSEKPVPLQFPVDDLNAGTPACHPLRM